MVRTVSHGRLVNEPKLSIPVQGEDVYTACKTAMAELIMSGCTTTSDHLYIYPNDVMCACWRTYECLLMIGLMSQWNCTGMCCARARIRPRLRMIVLHVSNTGYFTVP